MFIYSFLLAKALSALALSANSNSVDTCSCSTGALAVVPWTISRFVSQEREGESGEEEGIGDRRG